MTVDAQQHPQEMMAEVARIIDEWRYGPKLSETALSEIRVLTLAYLSARSAEPVACLTAAEQKAQGARCSCRGVDDYCPCQNVPDAETKKAGSAREDTAG